MVFMRVNYIFIRFNSPLGSYGNNNKWIHNRGDSYRKVQIENVRTSCIVYQLNEHIYNNNNMSIERVFLNQCGNANTQITNDKMKRCYENQFGLCVFWRFLSIAIVLSIGVDSTYIIISWKSLDLFKIKLI